MLKRGVYGIYHQHVSEAHLQRYLHEFDFRYNTTAPPSASMMLGAQPALSRVRLANDCFTGNLVSRRNL